jgi:ABC-type lipoprotein export system ATPase subunit
MGAFIEAENVCKTYRVGKIEVRALRGISFAVRRGEFVSVSAGIRLPYWIL